MHAPGDDPRTIAESWFRHHGLPWFTEAEDRRVAKVLQLRRLLPPLGLAVLASLVVGALALTAQLGLHRELPKAVAGGLVFGASTFGLLAILYALIVLRAWPIVSWAARRAFGELSLVLPLITRALPLLLLFNTFLFINTEVWQVASALQRSALWGIVLLFSGVAVAFLLAQLPHELSTVMDDVTGGGVEQACAGTPLEPWASQAAASAEADGGHLDLSLSPRQRANLLLVLLIAQAFQVVLLAVAVFVFFVLFGLVAIDNSVIEAWVGAAPHPVSLFGHHLVQFPVSNELFQVSIFLAAFSGLYFTVYAVSDPTYREQFFTHVSSDLERAVGVRAVYETLRA